MPRRDPSPTLEGTTLLVCVGAMKAATSWLWARLRETLGVAASPLEEVRFFDARFPRMPLMDVDLLARRRLDFHLRRPGNPIENLRARPAFRASVDRVRMIYDDETYLAPFASLARPGTRVLVDVARLRGDRAPGLRLHARALRAPRPGAEGPVRDARAGGPALVAHAVPGTDRPAGRRPGAAARSRDHGPIRLSRDARGSGRDLPRPRMCCACSARRRSRGASRSSAAHSGWRRRAAAAASA